ncbi:MAG: helix-turn-helix domain-containing protein [Lactobacillus panisapium]
MRYIGSKLKQLRHDLGLTQTEMAAGVISVSFYSKVERGYHDIGAEELIEILQKHNISFQEFFSGISKEDSNKKKITKLTNELVEFANDDNDVGINDVTEKLEEINPRTPFLESLILQAKLISATHSEQVLKKITTKQKKNMKKMIFQKDTEENQYLRIVLITGVIQIYDFDEAFFIVRSIIRRYQDVDKIQSKLLVALSVLMINYVDWSYKNKKFDYCREPLSYLRRLPCKIELAFSKLTGQYYECLISNKSEKANNIKRTLKEAGYEAYVKKMQN